MSHSRDVGWSHESTTPWAPAGETKHLLPSWAASVAAHVLLLLLFATSLRSCQSGGVTGEPEGKLREVRIFLRQTNTVSEQPAENENDAQQAANAHAPSNLGLPTVKPFELSEAPPSELALPKPNAAVIGAGSGAPVAVVPGDVAGMITPNAISRPAQALGLGQGEVSFFKVREKGSRFVYVLDSSGSMSNYGAIQVAKSELAASLATLSKSQQFQIIFYNQSARIMMLRGSARPQLYWATDVNRTLARQYISGIRADLGTDHMPALKKALRLGPEVIFLLTDADEPRLTARDLNELDKINQGRTRIHCVEFGRGPELRTDNYLKRLARQNRGTHRYVDVTKFERH